MSTDPELRGVAPGRQIHLEPVRPGVWLIIGGAVVAALGPLFGFLVGTMIGTSGKDDVDAMFVALFVGILVGGLGVAAALLGVRRVLGDRRRALEAHPSAGRPASTA
jgi:hypothetical protein